MQENFEQEKMDIKSSQVDQWGLPNDSGSDQGGEKGIIYKSIDEVLA